MPRAAVRAPLRAVAGLVALVLILILAALPAAADKKKKPLANGEIVSIDGRTLVLQVKKEEHTFVLTDETEYRRAKEELRAGSFREGDRVRVKYREEGDEKIAVRVDMWTAPGNLRRSGGV